MADDRPRTALRALAAAGCGWLLVLAFPPVGWWWCAPLAVAGSTLVLKGVSWPRGMLLGLAFGAVFFVGLMPWLRVVGPDAWLLLGGFSALYVAAMGAAVALVTRLPGWPVWVAAVWVLQELVRGRFPLGGYPWGRLAFSQPDSPFTPLAALAGTALVTFAVALTGTLLAFALLRIRTTARLDPRAAAALAGAGLTAVVGMAVPLPTAGSDVTAAVVQGNVPRTGMDAFAQREAVLRNHVQASEQLAADIAVGKAPQPQLVVWPENSSDLDPYTDAEAYDQIRQAVTALGVPTLVGLVVTAPDGQGLQNTGVVWDPQTGPGETYVKRHPVPFGEFVPFRGLLSPFVSRFDRVPRDFVAGDAPGVLQVGPAAVGDVICFEVAYDSVVRDVVRSGADVIAVQTNNATYGRTGQVEQQLAMARLRAVEHGRSVLVAATSGISAVIAPDGQVLEQAPEFTQDALVVRVPLRTALTPADRLGAVPEWLLALVGLAAVVAAVVLGRRTRTPDAEGSVPVTPAPLTAGRSTNTSADA